MTSRVAMLTLPILFTGMVMFMGNPAFDRLKKFGDATFIPGHVQPEPLADFDLFTRQYLDLLFSHMSKMANEGVGQEDAIDSLDQSRASSLANFDDLTGRNANRAYLERKAAVFE